MRKKNLIILPIFLILFVFQTFSQNPQISKVEPPNWWTNHTINPVRLLVRGENLQGAKVTSTNKFLKVSNVRINTKGNYLFFDVTIATNTKAGKYEFDLTTSVGKTKIPFEISPNLDKLKNFQGITNKDVIYLIMTDRFVNGDESNDKNIDRNNPRMWHGGDFRGIINKLDYLKELGITAIWLTPWYDNSDQIITCDKPWCPMSSYHGYGAIDYYGVENHFGTFTELRELIEKAHSKGIKVIQDQVANHVGYRHPWMENPPLENWFTPFQQNTFNNSVLLSPNSSQTDRDNLLHGWFDFSLPDLNFDEPEVVKYQLQNALWWIEMTGIDGIRQDTIQYMPRLFIKEWSEAILKQYPKFWMVGEVMKNDSVHTAFFQGGKNGWDGVDTKLPSVFDFNLWRTSQEVFTGKKPMFSLRDVLNYDGLYPNINNVTTMIGNHDTDRFMSLQGATLEGAMLHIAFILSTRGIPQLYAGEEIAMTGGHDPDNRKDFLGGWREDKIDKFTKSGRTANEQEMFEWTKKWINLRCEYPTLSDGKTIDLYYDNDVYVFERVLITHFAISLGSVSSIVAFNNSDVPKTVSFKFSNYFFESLKDLMKSVEENTRKSLKEKGLSNEEIEKRIGEFNKSLATQKQARDIVSILEDYKKIKPEVDGSYKITLPAKSAILYGNESDKMMFSLGGYGSRKCSE